MPELPTPLTSFIGRERELAEARQLLARTRLLTLTGPGGSGKTRLCVALAAWAARDYADGVCFVPLAPVGDPGIVSSSIAQHLGLQYSGDRPLLEYLAGYLRDREMLIVLDNFEHLLPAVSVLSDLLGSAPALRLLVSSRSPLRISGEQELPVPPLTLPGPAAGASVVSIRASESVRLFEERAVAVVPSFVVDARNAATVAEITRRLEGMPLAIELAAMRVKLLPPEAILPRLEHALGLLVGGSRDAPNRQQTLRSTIAWSYGLLTGEARRLLAGCSVFRGGATLETIESVCVPALDLKVPVLDGLQELVDQSLLRPLEASAGTRYAMLETVREFALERLVEMPEGDRAQEAHAAAFLTLVGPDGRPAPGGRTEREWLARLDDEHNNLRAALDWCGREDPPAALRLAAALSWFWSMHGHFSEGRQRLGDLLKSVADHDDDRIAALNGAAWLAIDQGDHLEAARLLRESLEASRRVGDRSGEGTALLYIGRNWIATGRVDKGASYIQQATAVLTEENDARGMALALFYSGLTAQFTGRLEAACELFSRCASMSRTLGLESRAVRVLNLLGLARLDLGDLRGAREALEESLLSSVDLGDQFVIPLGLAGFAGLAARAGRPRQAIQLAAAAEAYQQANDFLMPGPIRANLERWLLPARREVGAAAAKVAAEGAGLTLEEAVATALTNEPDERAWGSGPGRTLTRREAEVAALVAAGLTNREVAARLHLSARTVEVHVEHVLGKLGFHTRTQLAAWAYAEGLLTGAT